MAKKALPSPHRLLEDFQGHLLRLEREAPPEGEIKLEGELALAARFGVSRGSIREVLTHFQFLGVIERTRHKGSFLRRLAHPKLEAVVSFCFQVSGLGFEELKEARLLLEWSIVPLLARRLTPAGHARLAQNIRAMRLQKGAPEAADALDREFHLALFEISGNRALRLFANILHRLFRREHRQRYLNAAAVLKSAEGHEKLLAALRAQDEPLAREILRAHIEPT